MHSDSRPVIVPMATHPLPYENPAAFNEALLQFLVQRRAESLNRKAARLTLTSPRNYPGSCSQREPKPPTATARQALISEAFVGACWLLCRFEKGHNPKVAGSNPAPATMNDEGLRFTP